MFTFTVIANLLLKTGAVMGRDAGGAWWEQLLNWRVVAGFASFGAAALFYTILLRTVPLNVAQSFTAAQYVAVILASALVLSEPINAARWVGIFLIAGGIAIVGWS
jgi:drug/metabolite transporter (DMT)-like permease